MTRFALVLLAVLFPAIAIAQVPGGGGPTTIIPTRKDAANDSGSITIGGAWQQVIPPNAARMRIFIQNRCSAASQGIAAAESLFLNLSPNMPTSTDGAIELLTCGSYDSSGFVLNTQPVWLYAPSIGHKYIALEW